MRLKYAKTLLLRFPAVLAGRASVIALCLLLSFTVVGHSENQSPEEPSTIFPSKRHEELMKELDFTPPKKEQEEEEDQSEEAPIEWDWPDFDFKLSNGTSIIIFVILIALLGFLIYRMLGDVSMRKRTRDEEEVEEINVDDIEEEKLVAAGVSLSLLERAERAGQYDVAVRLLYIQLLKELQDAGLIKYRKDFSNRDYQNQLKGREVLADFRTVTRDYEKYWFGKYPIDRLSYRNTYQAFSILNESIRSSAVNTGSHV